MSDVNKLDEIVEKYYPELFNFCCCKVKFEDALDITQEVFLEFTETFLKTHIINPRAWLYTVMKRRIADYYRKIKTEHRILESYDNADEAAYDNDSYISENYGKNGEDELYIDDVSDSCIEKNEDIGMEDIYSYSDVGSADETFQLLADKIVEKLSPDEFRLYKYRYRDKFKYYKIAELEKITPAAARKRTERLRDKLIQLVKEVFE